MDAHPRRAHGCEHGRSVGVVWALDGGVGLGGRGSQTTQLVSDGAAAIAAGIELVYGRGAPQ